MLAPRPAAEPPSRLYMHSGVKGLDMSPATTHTSSEGSPLQLVLGANLELEELDDELLNYFDPHCAAEERELLMSGLSTPTFADQSDSHSHSSGNEPEQSRDARRQAVARHGDMLWNPSPSVPEFLRCELTSNLARDLDCTRRRQSSQDPTHAFPRQASGDSSADGNSSGRELTNDASRRDQNYPSLYERKLEINRQAQKRFRARRKDRAQAIQSQLAETTAELRELKEKQQQLETRNMLLEKVSHINNQHNTSTTESLTLADQPVVTYETCETAGGRGVQISLPGHQQCISVQDIAHLSLPTFATLWTDYVRLLGALLVHLGETQDAGAQARMEHLTIESTQLLGCIKALNPAVYKAIRLGRLDDGHTVAHHRLDAAWFANLPTLLGFSEAQMADSSYLRCLYLTRRALLAQERTQIIVHMHANSTFIPDPSDAVDNASHLSAKLRQNAFEDYETYIKISCGARRGIFQTRQWAILMVHAYPFFPGVESFFEGMIGTQPGEASAQEIMAGAQANPMHAEWRAFDDYLASITVAHAHNYKPIPRPSGESLQAYNTRPARCVNLHDMLL